MCLDQDIDNENGSRLVAQLNTKLFMCIATSIVHLGLANLCRSKPVLTKENVAQVWSKRICSLISEVCLHLPSPNGSNKSYMLGLVGTSGVDGKISVPNMVFFLAETGYYLEKKAVKLKSSINLFQKKEGGRLSRLAGGRHLMSFFYKQAGKRT